MEGCSRSTHETAVDVDDRPFFLFGADASHHAGDVAKTVRNEEPVEIGFCEVKCLVATVGDAVKEIDNGRLVSVNEVVENQEPVFGYEAFEVGDIDGRGYATIVFGELLPVSVSMEIFKIVVDLVFDREGDVIGFIDGTNNELPHRVDVNVDAHAQCVSVRSFDDRHGPSSVKRRLHYGREYTRVSSVRQGAEHDHPMDRRLIR